jgi:beta-glucosidase
MKPQIKTDWQTAKAIEARVSELLGQMTLAEKIGQMTQVEKNSISPKDVAIYFIGSILSGGGGNPDPNTVTAWRKMVQAYMYAAHDTRLGVPLIYGVDAVHGHSNVHGAVIFPHNIGLGATRDADLVERIGAATATAMLATNVHWNFAPAVSVPQDIRWGRSYEGYSENTDLVTELGVAYIHGMQTACDNGEWVLASVKHFAADGGTAWDSRNAIANYPTANWQQANENWRIDQGDARMDEATLRRVHLAPYQAAIEAGARNIMVSFSSWNGLKMHAHTYLLTDVLKGEWDFDGFLVSDWMAVDQLSVNFYEAVVMAINAGLDMIMVPYDYRRFIETLTRAVEDGDVPLARIDDAVTRILRVKAELGLFENDITDEVSLETFGGEAHRALAREAVQKSAVLLKHENNALPLSGSVAVVGAAADDIGLACGGWTIEWQGGFGAITEGSTLLDGLRDALGDDLIVALDGNLTGSVETAVVVVAETPYAEGEGDRDDLTLSDADTALIEAARAKCDKLVLVVYSGRPLIITHVVEGCDAVVAAFLPGSEANALADVLTGAVPFTGKLSFSWLRDTSQLPLSALAASKDGPLYPFGHGLSLHS